MMTMRFSMVMAGLAALTAVACGGSSGDGSGGGGSGKINTSIPQGTLASELSDAQTEELCRAAGDASEATFGSSTAKGYSCGFSAYLAASLTAGDAAACKKLYDECMKAPAESDSAEPCEKPSSACTATVGELQTCWNDAMAEGLAALEAMPGCDDVGKEDSEGVGPGDAPAEDDDAGEALPASCEVVQQKCPEALRSTP
jgi:hypothetical protein